MNEEKYLALIASLNDEQRAAVFAGDGCFVLAGAPGSGKTRCIVARVARLVHDGVDPAKILAMTFTRAAAFEMNRRLEWMEISGARVGTIHSVCRQILASETNLMTLYRVDERGLLRYEIRKMLWDARKDRIFPQRGVDRGGVERFLSACKASGICFVEGDPFELNRRSDDFVRPQAVNWAMDAGLAPRWLVEMHHEFERRRAMRGLLDFDDMLSWCWMLLVASGDVRARWRTKWQHVIVDEVQDNTPVQWDVSGMLTGHASCIVPDAVPAVDRGNLVVGGDSAQAIYGFRHADVSLYTTYAHRNDVTTLRLPTNYRAGSYLCAVASELARGKPWNLVGEIAPHRELRGELVVRCFPDQLAEAEHVVQECMELCASDGDYSRCAVLARLNVSLDLVEIACVRRRVPYIRSSQTSFVSSSEARDVLGYMRVAALCDPTGENLKRIVNRPFRFLSRRLLDKAEAEAGARHVSLLDALAGMSHDMSYGQVREVDKLYRLLQDLSGAIANGAAPAQLIGTILDDTDYIEYIRRDDGLLELDESKLACLGQIQHIAREFTTAVEFLSYIDGLAVAIEQAGKTGLRKLQGGNALVLSTIHGCKGLEYQYVHIVDVVQGRFPCCKSGSIDEEDRLFYVAITRAADRCAVSYSTPPEDGILSSHIIALARAVENVGGCAAYAGQKPALAPVIPSSCT